MFRLLLFVVVATFSVQAVEVGIRYVSPVLELTLPLINRNIGMVEFKYAVGDKSFKAKGVRTTQGWQFLTRDVNLDGADKVSASAVVYDINGNKRMSTPWSALTLDDDRRIAQLPSRRIRGAVIWRDDFNWLDKSKWKYEVSMYGGYNGEFQMYTNEPKNVFTKNGNLYIFPNPTVNDARFDDNFLRHGKIDMNALFGYCTISDLKGCYRDANNDGLLPPVMSGKIMSVPTLKYGTVEVRARIPKGDWIWPAIWMMPKESKYGGWPASGEIDIMESRGNEGYYGIQQVSSTLHWGPDYLHNKFQMTSQTKQSASWHNDFHTWKLEWSPDHLITYVDNQKVLEVWPPGGGFWEKGGFSGNNVWQSGNKMAPFDQEFYLILNVAVGGTSGMFPDAGNKPWKNSSPKASEEFWNAHNQWLPSWKGDHVAMEIDYVEFRHL